MLKVNLAGPLTDVKGVQLEDTQNKKKLLLKDPAVNLLVMGHPKTPKENLRYWVLAQKLQKSSGQINLEDEEFALLKQVIEKNAYGYTAMVVGQLLEVIDKAEKGK